MSRIPKERADSLHCEGEKLFRHIVSELNEISDTHVRVDYVMFRREEDYRELCIGLGLAVEMLIHCGVLPGDLWKKWSEP